jgi:hypothetical protein
MTYQISLKFGLLKFSSKSIFKKSWSLKKSLRSVAEIYHSMFFEVKSVLSAFFLNICIFEKKITISKKNGKILNHYPLCTVGLKFNFFTFLFEVKKKTYYFTTDTWNLNIIIGIPSSPEIEKSE